MVATRRLALVAGVLYLVTFVTAIPALALKAAILDPAFVLGAGESSGVLWAGVLEVLLAVACIGTALALYPIVRRHSEPAALGFLSARILEAAIILVGVISMLAIVTLRADLGGAADAEAASLVVTAAALVAVHDQAFLLGPGLIPAINALLLGWVLYRTHLVPRSIPALGLIGAPLLAASALATVFGIWEQVSVVAAMAAVPIALWELTLGIWLVAKGFRPDAIAALGTTSDDPLRARVQLAT
jgi:hypothetical protein